MEIDSETIPSPASAVQRETNIILVDPVAPIDPVVPTDLVAPIDMPRDITVGHKGMLGPDKLYRKQRDIKPLKEQPERARDQRDSQATFQP
jgi:hypothetical protein